jgi:hypothetical protein
MKFNSYSFKRLFSPASKFLLYIGLAGSLAACQWGDEITSLVQPNPDDFLVLFSDTSTVSIATVKMDSVMSASVDRMLVGRYDDPFFGKMHASTFFQTALSSAVTLPQDAIYDSLVLSMKYEKGSDVYGNRPYFYGDTTKSMTITAHALQEDIMAKGIYYNNYTIPFDAKPLSTVKLSPRPYSERWIQFKMPNELGTNMFTRAKNNLLNTNEQLMEVIKGFTVMAKSTDNGSVVGFQTGGDSTALRLYYHTTGNDGISSSMVSLPVTGIYNQILGDRSGTDLVALPASRRQALPSAKSGEKSFIQEGIGIMTRLDLPHLQTLKDVKFSVANGAYIRIKPFRQSVNRYFYAPPILHVYYCDKNNEILGSLTGLSSTNAVTANYVNDFINNTEYYWFDVTGYVTNILNSNLSENNGLLLVPDQWGKNPNNRFPGIPEGGTEIAKGLARLVIGSQKNTTDRGIKLELYYTTVKPQNK